MGGAVKRTFGTNNNGQPVLIIRKAINEFLVLTTICTHMGCEVGIPQSAGATIDCPCHGSKYSSLDGSVVNGPAPAALHRFPATYDAQTKILTITF